MAKGRGRVGQVRTNSGKTLTTVFTPAKTRKYEDYVKVCASQVMQGRGLISDALRIEVQAFVSIPSSWSAKKQYAAEYGDILPTTRPDADNYLKCCLDALNGIVYRDDSQIVDMSVKKRYSDRPRLEIEIFPV